MASATRWGVNVVLRRVDMSVSGWADKVRLFYRAAGLRYVAPASGKLRLNPSGKKAPATFAIQFPESFSEPPFVSVALDMSLLPREDQTFVTAFAFEIQQVTNSRALVRAYLKKSRFAPWTRSLYVPCLYLYFFSVLFFLFVISVFLFLLFLFLFCSLFLFLSLMSCSDSGCFFLSPLVWSARPYPASEMEIRQQGLFVVGPATSGPVIVTIPFKEIYRAIPIVSVELFEVC